MRVLILAALICAACGSNSTPARSATAPPEGATLTVEHVAGLGDPVVELHNVTGLPAHVTFTGATEVVVDLPTMTSKSVKMPAGSYAARVSAPDAHPAEWPMTVDADHRYSLTLKAGDHFANPAYVGKGLYCFEVETAQSYFLCMRTMERCLGRKAETPPTMMTSACSHEAEMFEFRAENGKGGAFRPFLRTQKECEALRARIVQQENPPVIGECALMR